MSCRIKTLKENFKRFPIIIIDEGIPNKISQFQIATLSGKSNLAIRDRLQELESMAVSTPFRHNSYEFLCGLCKDFDPRCFAL